MPKPMQKIGEALSRVIFGYHEKGLRNKHEEEHKQRELYQLEKSYRLGKYHFYCFHIILPLPFYLISSSSRTDSIFL